MRLIRGLIFQIINLLHVFAEDADLLRVGVEADLGIVERVEVEVEERLGLGEVRELVRARFAGREEDGVSDGDFLLAFRRAEQPLAAEDEEALLVDRVVVVGEARFLWREFDESCNAALRLGFSDKVDLFIIVDFMIRSARPDGVRGTGVADDGHGGVPLLKKWSINKFN